MSLTKVAHASSTALVATARAVAVPHLVRHDALRKQSAQALHSSTSLLLPRKPRNSHGGGNLRNHFGNYTRLAPTSLRLGVVPPDVHGLVPDHIQKPGYALRGEPSEWAPGIPINGPEEIEKSRRAGQLAKRILEIGGTLAKVVRDADVCTAQGICNS